MTVSTSTRRSLRVLLGAVLLDAAAMLPVGLTGAVAVQLGQDLGLRDQQLGLVATAFFATGGVAALLGLRLPDRVGWRRATVLAASVTTGALVLAVVGARGPGALSLAMALAGAGLALMMPATNLMLVSQSDRRYLAFMVAAKQAAVPLALLLAGIAVPLLALDGGWRLPFALAATFAPCGLAVLWSLGETRVRGPRSVQPALRIAPGRAKGLAYVGLGVGLASALPGALTGYLVLSLVRSGVPAGDAATLYAFVNGAGILVRLGSGWFATRWPTDGFRPVALLMVGGGLGAMLLGSTRPLASVVGACLAFALGWGWPGLLFFAVMRSYPRAPGAASAVVQSGGMFGAALGPLLAGALSLRLGWAVTWVVIGALGLLGAAATYRARAWSIPADDSTDDGGAGVRWPERGDRSRRQWFTDQ